MKAVFVELPAFSRYRAAYLDDEGFGGLQEAMMKNPEVGDVVEGTGGLRVIYYWWDGGSQFWLFTLYDKNEMADLKPVEKKAFKGMLKAELEVRR